MDKTTDKMVSTKNNFIVKILSEQNATWQGTITWIEEGKTEHFRSLLEFIRLTDSVIGKRENVE